MSDTCIYPGCGRPVGSKSDENHKWSCGKTICDAYARGVDAERAALLSRIETIETNYGHRVDTFIRDTEHLLGRVEQLEKTRCTHLCADASVGLGAFCKICGEDIVE